jgi:selenocysteine-specific elongation factor
VAKPPRALVLGTAGHIDHGKTTLVRALTGIDTDRLPEEKRRGITIELGFAPWRVGPDLEASIVDVPGHEAFVRTMVAGAGGIDAVLLVVSAEEGVMPQTREHLNVCKLLGVAHGVVALTKVDRLAGDDEAIALAVDDVRTSLSGSVFEGAKIVPVSAVAGAGIDALTAAVREMAAAIPRRDDKGPVVIPLDRVFTIKGHGTVVTGTLVSGTIDLDKDELLCLVPAGAGREARDVRARAAQVRLEARERIVAGNRIALNLAIDKEDVHRGDVLVRGPAVVRSDVVHAWLDHLALQGGPWKRGTTVELCAGTAHAVGRMDPLWVPAGDDGAAPSGELPAGRSGLVRIQLDAPLPVWRDQRVVVRGFADVELDRAGRTAGGGIIVDPEPSTGRAQRKRWVELGRALVHADAMVRALALVRDAGAAGIEIDALVRRAGIGDRAELLARIGGKGSEIASLPGVNRLVHESQLRPLADRAVAIVDRFHAHSPMQPGIGRAAVERMLGGQVAPQVAAAAVERAIGRGALKLVDDAGTLARPGKGLQAGGELPGHMRKVLDLYEGAGVTPPTLKEVAEQSGLPQREVLEMVGVLQRTGRLVKVTADLSYGRRVFDALVEDIRAHLRAHGRIDVQELKQLKGLTRKFAVPLLEHLDALGVTLRQGDLRIPGPRA